MFCTCMYINILLKMTDKLRNCPQKSLVIVSEQKGAYINSLQRKCFL